MFHNVFRYEYLTFQTQIHLHKQYIFDTNIIQSEYVFLFPFSIYEFFFKWQIATLIMTFFFLKIAILDYVSMGALVFYKHVLSLSYIKVKVVDKLYKSLFACFNRYVYH